MTYYLGVDGGGSKTACAVGDGSTIIGTGTAGPSNLTRISEDRARKSLHDAIRDACAAAQIEPRQIRKACVGVAGAGRNDIAACVRKIVAELICSEIEIAGDMEIALAAAFGRGPGIIVIAGTGSIAYGRDARGRTARAGGWGYAISDEGSAHWIGHAAVSALLRRFDERMVVQSNLEELARGSPLFCAMQSAWKLRSLDDFLRAANSRRDFAGLFPMILKAAEREDELAQQILTKAGEELARLGGIVVHSLFGEGNAAEVISVAMAGGVFQHAPHVRQIFCERLRKLNRGIDIREQIAEPMMGALQIARQSSPKRQHRTALRASEKYRVPREEPLNHD